MDNNSVELLNNLYELWNMTQLRGDFFVRPLWIIYVFISVIVVLLPKMNSFHCDIVAEVLVLLNLKVMNVVSTSILAVLYESA